MRRYDDEERLKILETKRKKYFGDEKNNDIQWFQQVKTMQEVDIRIHQMRKEKEKRISGKLV